MLTCNDNSMEMLIKKEDYTDDPNKVRFAHSNCYAEDYDDTYLKISTDFDKCNTTVTVRFVLIIREPSPENINYFGSTRKGDSINCILNFVFVAYAHASPMQADKRYSKQCHKSSQWTE